MDEFARQFSLDLAILAAGVWHGTTDNKIEDRALSDDIVAVNWTGTLNTIYAILPHMMRSGGGQIALISSIASHLGLEQSPAYCASKAALRIYGQGLGALLSRHGIAVTVVLPGFVDTSMLATFSGYRPGLVSAEKAARTIQHALQRKKPTCYFPLRALIGVLIVRMLPRAVQEYIARVVCRNFG
jgi:short-subunit dehydrogenase